MAEAGPGQILVTGGVRDIVRGGGFGFEDRGVHALRGIEGEWHLFELASVDGAPRPAPASAEEARARRDAIVPPPLVKRRGVRKMAIAAAAAFVFAGVALGLAFTMGGSSAVLTRTGCEVAPFGVLNDRGFNQAVFDGLTDAGATWGISARHRVTNPPSEEAAQRNIEAFAKQRCGLVVTVGGFMAPLTASVARRYPDVHFLTTDDPVELEAEEPGERRVRRRPGRIQGRLSGGRRDANRQGRDVRRGSDSHRHGFHARVRRGVLRYNREHATRVRMLGWNAGTGTGTFVSPRVNGNGEVFEDAARRR